MAKTFSWNKGQSAALGAPRDNLLVSAAAGSGKTAVLTERIFRLLTDSEQPLKFSDIVAITFTRAAAASLREKLAERLSRAVAENPENTLYRRLQMELPHAQISTVHSFCMRIIREHTASLGLPSGVRLADDAARDRLQKNCMRRAMATVFSRENETGEEETSALESAYYLITSERQKEITDLPLRLYDKLMALEEGVTKLSDLTEEAKCDLALWASGEGSFFDTSAGRLGKEQATLLLYTLLGRLKVYFSVFPEEDAADESVLAHAHHLQRAVTVAKELLNDGSFEEFVRYLKNFTPQTYANKSKTVTRSSPLGKLFKDFYDTKIKEPFVALVSDYSQDADALLTEERRRILTQSVFERLLSVFHDLYREEKRKAKILDYSDLEHLALKVLSPSAPTAYAPTAYCRALFVDEYQDTNRLQDALFRACVQKDGFFFFVGDVKQSIYRFRHAAPELFLSYKNHFPDLEHAENLADLPLGKSVFLSENFRSDAAVINFANRVFDVLMNDNAREDDRMYAEADHLKKGKTSEKGEGVEFCFIDQKTPGTKTKPEAFIVERVLKLIHEEHRRPEEIAVIAYTNPYLSRLRREFLKAGIPVVAANGELFESTEVQGLVSALKVIENPLSDIDLVSLCTGPLFSLSSDELFKIRLYADGPFYDALCCAASETNLAPIALRAREVKAKLELWRRMRQNTSISAFLLSLFHEEGLLSALSRGESLRRENLFKIYREACDFEVGEQKTLSDFLTYLQNRKDQSSQSESDAEVHPGTVTLMTVHKSKGLEFPVCILAQLGRQTKNETGTILDVSRGLYHRRYQAKHHLFTSSLSDKIVRRQENEAAREEAKRLLYVGITRAAEKLILVDTKATDVQKRFSESGVFPYLPGECIHSRDLQIPGNLLLYSLREDEELFRFAQGFVPASDRRQSVVCPTFTLTVVGYDTLLSPEEVQKNVSKKADAVPTFSEADAKALQTSLAAHQRRTNEVRLPTKLSVSEILHLDDDKKQHKTRLSFGTEDRRAAELGTAMHAFMQFCDFSSAKVSVEAEAARLCDLAFLSPKQADLNFLSLSRFFDSETFREIEKSPRVEREKRFNVFLPTSAVFREQSEGDILIQGVIDCFYEKEDGTYAILDFKTDAVNLKTGEETLLSRHAKQLRLYRLAVEELTGKRVSTLSVYSFCLGKTINVPLSEDE
ncbi:MAG: UvrD-helicase domain-containing protein [Clostridia bacterium]|nr:UvrD-helicase domain-containing protein [Clostridia bacterium]